MHRTINLKKKKNIFRKILSFFCIFFKILFGKKDELKDPARTCEVELGIEVNNPITVYGEIIYNFITKNLRIEKPEFFLKDKSLILDEIFIKIKRKRFILIVCCLINFYCGVKLLKKLFDFVNRLLKIKKEREMLKLKNEKEKLKLKNERERLKFKDLDKFKQEEKLLCGICYEHIRNIILAPCNHMIVCHLCLEKLEKKQCPICRGQYHSFIEIFSKE